MSKIKDAAVSVIVEIILLVPSVVKNILKRYKLRRSKKKEDNIPEDEQV